MIKILEQELSNKIDKNLVKELLREYVDMKRFFITNNKKDVLLHAARFSELILAILINLKNGLVVDINSIKFEKLYQKIKNFSKNTGEEELLFLAIPRVARSLYTLRSKKRVSHVKKLDPIFQDSSYVNNAVDWILSSFIFLYSTKRETEIRNILSSLLEKQVPFLEEFEDGGVLILKKVEFKWKTLLILYHQNKFIKKQELKKLLKPKYRQLLDTNLRKLEEDNLIYNSKNRFKITRLGIKKVETDILNKM